jgi:hypothetical protein
VPTGTKTAIPAFGTLPKKSKQTWTFLFSKCMSNKTL